jgi:hypothetical protein
MPTLRQLLVTDITIESMGQFVIGMFDDTESNFQLPQTFLDYSDNLEIEFRALSVDLADEQSNFAITTEKSISQPYKVYLNNITDTSQTISIRVVR